MCTPRQRKLCRNSRCDVCKPRRIPIELLRKYWIKEKNPGIDPVTDIMQRTDAKFWVICKDCGHHVYTDPRTFINSTKCGYCTTGPLCEDPLCNVCNERRDPCISQYWIYEKNGDIDPITISKGVSKTHYWFNCKACGHETHTEPRSFAASTKCVYCTSGRMCANLKCKVCNKRRDPLILQLWMYEKNGDYDPYTLTKSSDLEFWFKCIRCSHETYNSVRGAIKNKGCRYCDKQLCSDYDCQICLPNRFSSHPMSKYWDYTANNGRDPRDLRPYSSIKCIFICPYCNKSYPKEPKHITYKNTWCPCRTNKTETLLKEWLKEEYPRYTITPQYRLESLDKRRFDFYIPELNLIIEVDGEQHFKQVSRWHSPFYNLMWDCTKMTHALGNRDSIIRILQEDIWHNRIDWKSQLSTHIRKYEVPQVIYTSGSIYDCHRSLMNNMDLLDLPFYLE